MTYAIVFVAGLVLYLVAWTIGHGAGWKARAEWMRCEECGRTMRPAGERAPLVRSLAVCVQCGGEIGWLNGKQPWCIKHGADVGYVWVTEVREH